MTSSNSINRRRFVMSSAALAGGAVLTKGLTTPALAQSDEFVVALAAPMTGDSAAFGLNAQRGADLAVEAINAAGGIDGKTVRYEIFDDLGQPREAATVARRIINSDTYTAVLGHVNSSCTLAAMPIYSDAGIPVLCGSSSNPNVTESGWGNIIRMTIRGDYGAQQYSAYAVNNLGKTKLAILFVNDDFGRGLRDEMMIAADALGAEVVANEGFIPNVDKDFSSIVTTFKQSGADVYMLNCNYTEGGLFLGQAKNLGAADVPSVGPDSLLYNDFIELSQGAANGASILAAYDPYSKAPRTEAFMGQFRETYDALPSQVAVFTHDLLLLTKDLMEAGATPQTLIEAAKATTFEGAGGSYRWDAKGDVKDRTFAVIEVADGGFVSTGEQVNETGLEALRDG